MSQIFRSTIVLILLLCSAPQLAAATPTEFYGTLLRRGVGEFDAGRFAEAARYLRLAAFGFVDSVEQYQTAQAYLAIAYDRLGDADRARDAAMRILRAERVARRFAALPLPAGVRAQFDRIAPRLLTTSDLAALRSSDPLPPLRTQTATARPVTTPAGAQTQTPVIVDRVDVEVTRPRTTDPAVSGTNGSPHQTEPSATAVQTRPAGPASTPASSPQTVRTETPRPAPAQPATTQTATAQPRTQPPAQQPTTPARTTPAAQPPQRTVTFSAGEIASRLEAAERALTASNLTEARRIYGELLGSATIDHDTAISVAEGLYRSRDFAGALTAFGRAGALRAGEEPYRYYIAVALYETGRYAEARRELAAALPHIEITPDVARYRAKIESALE